MANILDSYLVELGVSVKPQDITLWDHTLDKLGKRFDDAAKKHDNWMLQLATGATGLMASAARADMAMQKLSVRLYTTVEGARQFSRTMSAMGLKGIEDLKDVANNPELTEYYRDLLDVADRFERVRDPYTANWLKLIRQLLHTLDRVKVAADYIKDRLASSILKTSFNYFTLAMLNIERAWQYFATPEGMATIDRVGEFMGEMVNNLYRIGKVLVDIGMDAAHAILGIVRVWKVVPEGAKEFLGLGSFAFLAKRNPAMAGYIALSDYAKYHEDKISGDVDEKKLSNKVWAQVDKFFGPYWENFDPAIDILEKSTSEDWQIAWVDFDEKFRRGVETWEKEKLFPTVSGIYDEFNSIIEDVVFQVMPIAQYIMDRAGDFLDEMTFNMLDIILGVSEKFDHIVDEAFNDFWRIYFGVSDEFWKIMDEGVFTFLDPIYKISENFYNTWRDVWKVYEHIYEWIKQLFNGILFPFRLLKRIFNPSGEKGLSFSRLGTSMMEIMNDIDGISGDKEGTTITKVYDWMNGTNTPTSQIENPLANNNTTNSTNNNITINVSGAESPGVVAATIKNELSNFMMPIATSNTTGLVH